VPQLAGEPLAVDGSVARYTVTCGGLSTGQILAFVIGNRIRDAQARRQWDQIEALWARLPRAWRHRIVYTDGYGAYASFFSAWQHRVCEKFAGGTSTVEGVNNSLRHRCGWLVRRSSARARDVSLLERRLWLSMQAHNRDMQKRLNRRQRRYADSTHSIR
jgi:IS1 family transposase